MNTGFGVARCAWGRRVCPPVLTALVHAVVFFSLRGVAPAEHTNIWHFTNATDYTVSDPTLIKVDTASPGKAVLLLQAQQIHDATISEYREQEALSSLVRYGFPVAVHLTKGAGGYAQNGVYTSRILEGPSGGRWRYTSLRASNVDFVTDSGLVAWYRMDNDGWLDGISRSNAVAYSSPTFSAEAKGGTHSGSFRGGTSGDYVRLVNNTLLQNAVGVTLACWVKLDTLTPEAGLVTSSAGAQFSGLSQRQLTQPGVVFYVRTTTAMQTPLYAPGLPAGQWVFVTGTWGSTGDRKIRMYVNGQLAATSGTALTGLYYPPTWWDVMVDRYSVSQRASDGLMDELVMWSRELSSNEVAQLYVNYSLIYPLRYQVRSGDSASTVSNRVFVGPGGTANSYYFSETEEMKACADFIDTDRYAQYRLSLASSTDSLKTPYVDSVGMFGTRGGVFDDTVTDFSQGAFTWNTTYSPSGTNWSYLGLAKKENGGYPTTGEFVSRVIDAGSQVSWDQIEWGTAGQELGTDIAGLIGLYHCQNWADMSGAGHSGNSAGSDYTATGAKLGAKAAVFDGLTHQVGGFGFTKIQSVEFWIRNDNASDAVLMLSTNGTGSWVTISNRTVVATGFTGNQPTTYVNGHSSSVNLVGGWNHLALTWPRSIAAESFTVGRVGTDYMAGMVDEMAVYNRVLSAAEIRQHYVMGRREVGGRAKFQVRASNDPKFTGVIFTGQGGNPLEYYYSPSVLVVGSGRYFQYKVVLEGTGDATPGVGTVRVAYSSYSKTAVDDSADDFHAGSFGGTTRWYGEELHTEETAAVGPPNQTAADYATIRGLWHMDESTWGTVLDEYGVGHGTAEGGAQPSPAARVGSHCGAFDGVNDKVTLGNGAFDAAPFSVCFWFKTSTTLRRPLISTYSAGNRYFTFEINGDGAGNTTDGKVAFAINDTSAVKTAVSFRKKLNDGNWHHVAGLRNSGQILLYVDGGLVGGNNIGSYGAIGGAGAVVASDSASSSYYDGFIDEIIIFSHPATRAQIGRFSAAGYRSESTATYVGPPMDGNRPSTWQTLAWSTHGIYGEALTPSDGSLMGLWHLDETNGVTAADSSGRGHPGTITGYLGGNGVLDRAVGLSNATHKITIADHSDLEPSPATLSVEAWVYPASTGQAAVFDKRGATSGYALGIDSQGRAVFWVGDGSPAGITCTGVLPVPLAQWNHLAGTYDGMEARLYVNGCMVRQVGQIGGTLDAGGATIGQDYTGGSQFRGMVDEVAVHNRALEPAEIEDHYSAGTVDLKFQVRVSNDPAFTGAEYVGPGGSTETFYTKPSGNSMLSDLPLGRYAQYRALLSTEDPLRAPTLYGVTVDVSSYPSDNPYVEPASGYTFPGDLPGFGHALGVSGPNTEIRYQISGNNGATWYYWNGLTWAPTTGAAYPLERNYATDIGLRIGSFFDQLYPKTGGTFKFRAFLHSVGDYQIELDRVHLVATEGRVVLTAPNGTENGENAWVSKVPYDITWTWVGKVSPSLVLEYSLTGAKNPTWITITNAVPRGAGGTGSLRWRTAQVTYETNVYVRVRDPNDANIQDVSDGAFTLERLNKVVKPNGGEKWFMGWTTNVVWESAWGNESLMQIRFAPDGTNFSKEIAFATRNVNESKTNSYAWTIPTDDKAWLSEGARIRVMKPNGELADDSDGTFTLAGVVVSAPTAGRKVKRGENYRLEWTSAGAGANLKVDFSGDSGATYTNIFASVPNLTGDTGVVWTVTGLNPTDHAVLRFTSLSDSNVVGYSPIFTLADIQVSVPNGVPPPYGEIWLAGSTQTVTWTSGGAGTLVNIAYSTDSGATWLPIQNGVPNSHSYLWTVSRNVSKRARIRVQSVDDTNLVDKSDHDFNIAGVRVTFPNLQDDLLVKGQSYWMTHDAAPETWRGARLEISYDQENTWKPFDSLSTNWNLGDPFLFTPNSPSRQTKTRVKVNESPGFTNVFDASDEYFVVAGMLIQAPTNNARYTIGWQQKISWISAGAAPVAYVKYQNEPTAAWVNLTPGGVGNNQVFPGLNEYLWTVPRYLIPSTTARIKVESGVYSDTSLPFVLRGIRITQPDYATVWNTKTSQVIAWKQAGIHASSRATISLSLNGGADGYPYTLTNQYAVVDLDFFLWRMDPSYDPTTNAVIRIKIDTSSVPDDTTITAYSDAFTLRGVKVTSPAAGEIWELGKSSVIRFVAGAAGELATLKYSADGGAHFESTPIVSDRPIVNGPNQYTWDIEPNRQPSTNAVIRVEGQYASGNSPVFTVGGINVLRPMQYDIWAVGETNLIQWQAVGTLNDAAIELVYPDAYVYTIEPHQAGSSLNWLVSSNAVRGQKTVSNVVARVRDIGGFKGESEPFKIVSEPRIEIVDPKAGDFWKVGETKSVRWVKGGQMDAADFRVFFSQDNFATYDEIDRPISFNATNNMFSLDWPIPDLLGATKLLVTNTHNAAVFEYSGSFDIAGSFRVIYPNGDTGEAGVYAKSQVQASWGTRGSVPLVNLYYKYSTNNWQLITTSGPVANNGGGLIEQLSGAPWNVPDLQTLSARFRVQDSRYAQIFDGLKPGPYDDSDRAFAVKYYTILWDVGYVDKFGYTQRLDKLSVSDSSGWSQSGLSCLDPNGQPQYVTHTYPYGVYDTEWHREYFQNKIDYHWRCDSNHVRRLLMTAAAAASDYHVMANFTYSTLTTNFTIQSWIERGGSILEDPERNRIIVYDSAGDEVVVLDTTTSQHGVFWQQWNASGRSRNEIFFARVEILYSGIWYSSGLTFMMRQPASEEIETVVDYLEQSTSNILAEVSGVGAKVDNVHSNVLAARRIIAGGFSNLAQQATWTTNKLEQIGEGVQLTTNEMRRSIDFLTNQMVAVIGPAISNLVRTATNLEAMAEEDLARILTRPTTVPFGAPVSILYKTRRGYDPSAVLVTVSNTSRTVRYEQKSMSEVSGGIYQADLTANWGTNSFVITCTDPKAADSMILTVVGADVALAPMIASISNQLDTMSGRLTNVQALVRGLDGIDFRGMTNQIGLLQRDLGRLMSVTGAVARVDRTLGGMTGVLARVDRRVGTVTGTVARLDRAMITATGAVARIDRSMGAVTGAVARLESVVGTLTNLSQLVGTMSNVVSTLGDLPQQMTYLTNQVTKLSSLAGLDETARGISNAVAGLLAMTNLNDMVQAMTNAIAALGDIPAQLTDMTNALAGFKGMPGQLASVSNAVALLGDVPGRLLSVSNAVAGLGGVPGQLASVSNAVAMLGALPGQIVFATNRLAELSKLTSVGDMAAALSNAVAGLKDMTNLPSVVSSMTNAVAALGDLPSQVIYMTNELTRLGGLANLGGIAGSLSNAVAGLKGMTNLPVIVSSMTNAVAALGDLPTQVTFMTNELAGLKGVPGQITAVSNRVWLLRGVPGQLVSVSNAVAQLKGMPAQLAAVSNAVAGLGDLPAQMAFATNKLAELGALASLGDMAAALSNAVAGLKDMTNLPSVVSSMTNAVAALGDLPSQVIYMTNELTRLAGLSNLGGIAGSLSNAVAGLKGMTNLPVIVSSMTNAVAALGDLPSQVDFMTNALAGLKGMPGQLGSVSNAVALLRGLPDQAVFVTNRLTELSKLLSLTDMAGTLSNAVAGLEGMTNLPTIISAMTNAVAALGDLPSQVIYMTNELARLGGLTGLGDIAVTLSNAVAGLSGVTNLADLVTELKTAVGGLGGMTNLPEMVSDMTNAVAGLAGMAGVVDSMTNAMAGLGRDVRSITGRVARVDTRTGILTGQVARIDTRVGMLTGRVARIDTRLTSVAGEVGTGRVARIDTGVGILTGGMARVTAGVGALVGEVGTGRVARIDTGVAQLVGEVGTGLVKRAASVQAAAETDLTPVQDSLDELTGEVGVMQQALAAIDLTAVDRMQAQIGQMGDSASANTFFGRLALLERLIQNVGGTAGDAAQKAQQAKTEAANAVTGLQELKQLVEQGDLQGAVQQIVGVKDALVQLQGTVADLPKAVQYNAIQNDLVRVAKILDQFASSQGYPKMLAGEFGIPGFDAAAFGKFMGDSQTSIGSLTALITDMKGTIDFLSKYVEEKKNEPVVTTTFIGEVE